MSRLKPLLLLIALQAAMASTAAQADCVRENFAIAIDIGHTPEDPGAISARGIPEFTLNMALGRDVEKALRHEGFPARRIIVSGRGVEQLSARVAAAQALSPRLVISIHHDSVQERYLQRWRFAGAPQRYADRFSGFSIFVSRANPQFQQSLALARALGESLAAGGLRPSHHHAENIKGENREILDGDSGVFEFRNLRVLKDAPTAAILLEAGIIVNRAEEIELASPQRRLLAARAIVEAVTFMCEHNGHQLVLENDPQKQNSLLR
jgi:N-acetylmuramoyl-L-alanine amidase